MYQNYMNKPAFMSSSGNTGFGASTSSFGQPAANTSMFSSMQQPNIFQTPNTSSFSTGPSAQSSFGANLFGQAPQPSTSGLFGSSNAFSQNKSSFGFGSTPAQTGIFGQQPQQQPGTSLFQSSTPNLFGSNAFGNQTTGTVVKFSPVTGTDTMQKNGVTQSISTKHHCITCMKEYENKSLEELRFEDYSCNRKGPQQQPGFGAAPFGAPTSGATTSLFGQTDNKQSFGQPQGFGQTPAFGQTTSSFGVTNQTNSAGLFGKPNTFGTPTSTTPTFGFNPTPSTSNPFTANQTQKPFSQPLFGNTTTQAQPSFGTGVFGQTNTQNTATNLFQKPAQPTTGFNTGQQGFSFSQPATTQSSNLFQAPKPNTGFVGIFGQTNTTPGFGQTSQPAFGGFGKQAQPSFTQTSQPAFGTTNLTGGLPGLQQPSLFGNTTAKPPTLFGNATTGGGLFNGNVFQQTPPSFSLNMNQQQPVQFPPELSDDNKSISLIASDSFPDGPHVYGLEPVLSEAKNNATNPQDIKAVLDYSKKKDETLGTRTKIKVNLPKPKRGNNYNKEFFETNQGLRNSHKCLVIRKFNDSSSTIYNKYKSDILKEAEECLNGENAGDGNSFASPRSNVSENEDYSEKFLDLTKGHALTLHLPLDANFGEESDDTRSNTFDDSSRFSPTAASTKSSLLESRSPQSTPRLNGISIDFAEEGTTITESNGESSLIIPSNEDKNVPNPAGVVLTRPEYYMYPDLKDLQQYMDENGECVVQGLTIGRRGYGNVYFQDPINIANINLDEIVHFRHREVIIYPDDTKKPPVGEGLNRRAQVTLDKIFPREKGTNDYITEVNQIIESNFVDKLMHVTAKHNSKFVDYRPKTGSWVFKVKHFSKYGFTESDEEECEVHSENNKSVRKPQDFMKKPEVGTEPEEVQPFGLGGVTQGTKGHIQKESYVLADRALFEYWPEHSTLHEDMYHSDSTIQNLKSSLFTNLETFSEKKRREPVIVNIQEVPSEVLCTPRVRKLPDISLAILPEKVTTTQRCYTELGIFKCNTYKIGWGRGFHFYNLYPSAENEIVYAITQCSMNVECTGRYNTMMPNITDMLQVTLDASEFAFDNNQIPVLHIKKDLTYLLKQTDLFNDHVKSKNLTGQEKYLCSVWNLCSALWGPGANDACSRRQNVSDWLKKFAYDLSDEWSLEERMDPHESEIFKTIFKRLSFYKVPEACELATKNNLNQLSLLISQMSANERSKHWMGKYIDNFVWKEKNVLIDDFKKLYLLLSGIPVHDSINICDNLDWLRCFGLYLWYIAPSAAPVSVAFNLFKTAFEELEYATKPKPPYCDFESATTEYDLLYHILALYVDSTYQLCKLLHPETHTKNVMDYRLSWFLLQLFQSLNVGLVRDSELDHVHTTFSTQLENMGLWKWAIFPLIFLENNILKKNLIMRILDRNLSAFAETSEVESELVKRFKIPQSWIHEVKVTKCKVGGHVYDYFHHSLFMGDWKEANTALVDHILPELFVSGHHHSLAGIIKKIEPFSNRLVNWNTQTGLISDFLDLEEVISGEKNDQVSYLASKLTSFLRRIGCFPVTNDKQKLCLAELSRKCALIFKILQKNLNNEAFQAKFVDVISSLTMPPDIKHHEIYYLITAFSQENGTVI